MGRSPGFGSPGNEGISGCGSGGNVGYGSDFCASDACVIKASEPKRPTTTRALRRLISGSGKLANNISPFKWRHSATAANGRPEGVPMVAVAYTGHQYEQTRQKSGMEDPRGHLPIVCPGRGSPFTSTLQRVDCLSSARRCVPVWGNRRLGFAASCVPSKRSVFFPIARPTFPVPTPPSSSFLSRPANPGVFATSRGRRPAVFQHLVRPNRRGGEVIGLWYGIDSRLLCRERAGNHCVLSRFLRTPSSLETQAASRKG
jgi:hypothetical protein